MDDGTEIGIKDGEYVLADISLTEPVPNRVFVLQIIGDGMTVKRLKQQAGIWMFVADNKASDESWRADEVEIIGQVYAGGGYKYIH
jgi:SOS-response transcriptional repressor LexA